MRRKDPALNADAPRRSGVRGLACPLVALLIALVCFAPRAAAQIVRIGPDTPRSVTLSPEQQDEIDAFLGQYAAPAFGDDRGEAKRAMDELIEPLLGDGVSVSFRQAYADRLAGMIEGGLTDQPLMLTDTSGNASINHKPYNALRLAGEIATDRTLGMILEELASEDTGRRYFAIHSIETVLYHMRNSPAVTGSTILNRRQGGEETGLIIDLGNMLSKETSGQHAAAMIRALAEAAELPSDIVPGASDAAMRMIGNGTAARVRATANKAPAFEDILAWLTAGQRLVRRIAQPGSADAQASLAAIRLGGQLVASVYEDLEAGRVVPADERATAAEARVHNQMLGVAENLILFGEQNAASATNRRQSDELRATAERLQELFAEGKDSEFRRAALGLISPNGLLTAQPYGFTDDEFIVE